ncbi:hypothetical protein BaRGS_00000688 [Batillaria attramentaria]|uniref:Uncharacterized protein n=1 Tax=Batillaria attramentaria TaxID=370345 RepID=A0ABD0M8Z0_9CAEN
MAAQSQTDDDVSLNTVCQGPSQSDGDQTNHLFLNGTAPPSNRLRGDSRRALMLPRSWAQPGNCYNFPFLGVSGKRWAHVGNNAKADETPKTVARKAVIAWAESTSDSSPKPPALPASKDERFKLLACVPLNECTCRVTLD